MKAWHITAAALVAVGTVTGGAALPPAPASAAAPTWLSDFEQARTLSAASGKPLFVVFR